MSEHSFTVLWLAILVLGMFYLSFAWRLSYLKHRRIFRSPAQAEGFAGKYLKDYKPRTTIHSIVNMLFTKPALIPDQTAVLAVDEFSDVSFHQGDIDWVVMITKADKVIIRAGQGSWTDVRFIWNYSEAKRVGMSRGAYWFYDSRIDPGRQAALFVSLIKDDIPELGAWCDFEHDYGGSFGGLRNAVAFMQEVQRLLPAVKMGFYTGFYYMAENTNPIYNASQYAYLARLPLWLAWYGTNVRVPAPWTKMYYHQFGTPAVGREWGVSSFELDMNQDLSGDTEPPPEPEPPMEGADMKGTVKAGFTLKVRDAAGVDTGKKLYSGDSVYGDEAADRIYYPRVYRDNDVLLSFDAPHNSAVRDGGTEWMTLTDEAEPVAGTDNVMVRIDLNLTADVNGKRYAYHLIEDLPMVAVNG